MVQQTDKSIYYVLLLIHGIYLEARGEDAETVAVGSDEEYCHASFFPTGHDNEGHFSLTAQTHHGNK